MWKICTVAEICQSSPLHFRRENTLTRFHKPNIQRPRKYKYIISLSIILSISILKNSLNQKKKKISTYQKANSLVVCRGATIGHLFLPLQPEKHLPTS